MSQGDKTKKDQISEQKMAIKVTKGQIYDGTISKFLCREMYYLCGKFHAFMKKCTIFAIQWNLP